ncbi:MAG: hypothetical protein ACRD2W_20120 [Acidimicrobiales bacterium]
MEPEDVVAWAAAMGVDQGAVALHTVRPANDWATLRTLSGNGAVGSARRAVKVVALLVDATPDRHAEALPCGADGAVPLDSPRTHRGHGCVRPRGRYAAADERGDGHRHGRYPLRDPGVDHPEETEWLRMLATGATVQQLAERIGSSERALYRVLHGVYGRMRVSSPTEAIVLACRCGLLEADQLESP